MSVSVELLDAAGTAAGVTQPGRPGRVRAHLDQPLYRSTYALLLNTGVTSVLGIAYWALAARFYPADDVGRASAAISALMLVSGVAQCSLNNVLLRLVPSAGPGTARLVLRSYAVVAAVSILLAGAFVTAARSYRWADGLLTGSWAFAVWFVVAVVAWSVFNLQDAVLAGLRRAAWIPVENAAFSVAKIVLLVALAGITVRYGLFASFTIPVAVAIVPVNALIFARLLVHRRSEPVVANLLSGRRLRRYLANEYVGGLCNLATMTVMPLVVLSSLGATATAYFYSAWVTGAAFEYVLANIVTSLVVEGAHDEGRADWAIGRSIVIASAVLVPAVGACLVASPFVLGVLGTEYSAQGASVLRLIGLAALPRSVVVLSIASARIGRRLRRMMAIQVASCALSLGLAAVLIGPLGLAGAGFGYLAAQSILAATLVPALARTLRAGRTAPTVRPGHAVGAVR